jgi:hypothetical protein
MFTHSLQPEDWDEEAPFEIPDEDATKPEGWLDDEPTTVPDPGQLLSDLNQPKSHLLFQMPQSLRNGTTLRTVTGSPQLFPTLNARKDLGVVNGNGESSYSFSTRTNHLFLDHTNATMLTRANGQPPRSKIQPTKDLGLPVRSPTQITSRISHLCKPFKRS